MVLVDQSAQVDILRLTQRIPNQSSVRPWYTVASPVFNNHEIPGISLPRKDENESPTYLSHHHPLAFSVVISATPLAAATALLGYIFPEAGSYTLKPLYGPQG